MRRERQREAGGDQRRAHALARFRHGLVGQPDDMEGGKARRHLHLHVDGARLDALERHGGNALNHCRPPLPAERLAKRIRNRQEQLGNMAIMVAGAIFRKLSQALGSLDYSAWADTCATLHLWTQVVGKIRLALTPRINHWWGITLYVTARGLTTSPMPWRGGALQIDFDFIDHELILRMSDGRIERVALAPRSVADFYAEVTRRLQRARRRGAYLDHAGGDSRRHPLREPTTSTRATMPRRPICSGSSSCRCIVCSIFSARAFSANAARCISSGAASISR